MANFLNGIGLGKRRRPLFDERLYALGEIFGSRARPESKRFEGASLA